MSTFTIAMPKLVPLLPGQHDRFRFRPQFFLEQKHAKVGQCMGNYLPDFDIPREKETQIPMRILIPGKCFCYSQSSFPFSIILNIYRIRLSL